MPRRQTHASIAFILIFLVLLIFGTKYYNWVFMTGWFLFLLGSLAPDYIEPSYQFTHRSFFHSQKILKILSISTAIIIVLWLIFKNQYILFVCSFLLGYIGHLLLDSTTKMGLPKDKNPTGLETKPKTSQGANKF